jgi:TetR/AcrR family transcriptional regulator, transcriptional repressor for nem operon
VREAILDSAERRMRTGGYHACSFRDIASDVGVKSASVHYYFATKADLAAALVERYRLKFIDLLGEPADARSLEVKLEAMRSILRSGLIESQQVCLGAMLGAEAGGVPTPVAAANRAFFANFREWLKAAFEKAGFAHADAAAVNALATVEGAMIVAHALGDIAVFDVATAALVAPPSNQSP